MAGKKKTKELAIASDEVLARRYGIRATAPERRRYSTPEEIAEKPDAWEGDVSDLLEEEEKEEEQVEETAPPIKKPEK